MNRNRVLHPAGGWKWLTAPLSNSSIHIPASEATLQDPRQLRSDVPRQLSHYRRAPHYRAVLDLVLEALDGDDPSLVRLNLRALSSVCRYIGLPFQARLCSELTLGLPARLGPGLWAPAICAALGASAYVNPVGGRHLFDPDDFSNRGIELRFLAARPFPYRPGPFPFIADLSVLDALMWNPPGAILNAIHAYDLVAPTPEQPALVA